MRTRLLVLVVALSFLLVGSGHAITGSVNFVVLRVTFSDFGTNTRFTTAQTQTNFNSISQLWNESSYGNLTLNFQLVGHNQVAEASTAYLDQGGGNSSSTAAIVGLVNDAVATTSNTMNWNNVYGVVVVFGDTRAGGFYRGITLPGTTPISPPSGGSFNVHASIVGQSPSEDLTRTWGRWAHEVGHQIQGNPATPGTRATTTATSKRWTASTRPRPASSSSRPARRFPTGCRSGSTSRSRRPPWCARPAR